MLWKNQIQYGSFFLALFFSCRPGEVIDMNWSDYAESILTIRASAIRVDGKTIRTSKPKTKSSKRLIVLPEEVTDALTKWRSYRSELKLKIGERWHEES